MRPDAPLSVRAPAADLDDRLYVEVLRRSGLVDCFLAAQAELDRLDAAKVSGPKYDQVRDRLSAIRAAEFRMWRMFTGDVDLPYVLGPLFRSDADV